MVTTGDPGAVTLEQAATGLRAWGTNIHAQPSGGYAVTETPFANARPSGSELSKLASYCSFSQADGSLYGICKTCANGAAGAVRQ